MFVTVLFILGTILMFIGIAGCFLPFIPGPPLSFLALLIQQMAEYPPYSTRFLVLWGGIALVVSMLDYAIPVYSTKKAGGSKYGFWGCTIGLVAGFWLGPFGIIIGPFLGAFLGEYIATQQTKQAFKAAIASFFGFLVGTLLKVVVCVTMAWYLFRFGYQTLMA